MAGPLQPDSAILSKQPWMLGRAAKTVRTAAPPPANGVWKRRFSAASASATDHTAAIDPDDHVTIEYSLESDNNTWTQTVTSQKLGKVVSTLRAPAGPCWGMASASQRRPMLIPSPLIPRTTCAPSFISWRPTRPGARGLGGQRREVRRNWNGLRPWYRQERPHSRQRPTWLVDLITLPAMNPQGTQTGAANL